MLLHTTSNNEYSIQPFLKQMIALANGLTRLRTNVTLLNKEGPRLTKTRFLSGRKKRYGLAITVRPDSVSEDIVIHHGERIEALAAEEVGKFMANSTCPFQEPSRCRNAPYDAQHS